MSKGVKTPGPGQYSIDEAKIRPKTAGGKFGGKYSSSLAINPQTAKHVGPGSYNYAKVGTQKGASHF